MGSVEASQDPPDQKYSMFKRCFNVYRFVYCYIVFVNFWVLELVLNLLFTLSHLDILDGIFAFFIFLCPGSGVNYSFSHILLGNFGQKSCPYFQLFYVLELDFTPPSTLSYLKVLVQTSSPVFTFSISWS